MHDGVPLSSRDVLTRSHDGLGALPEDLLVHVGSASDVSLMMLHRASTKDEAMDQARVLQNALNSVRVCVCFGETMVGVASRPLYNYWDDDR